MIGKEIAEFHGYGDLTDFKNGIPVGTLVQLDKPGEEWSSIKLADGSKGIIRTKSLRRAMQSDMPRVPAMSLPREAISSAPTRYVDPPAQVPLPEIPQTQPQNTAEPTSDVVPLGAGLLPPVPQE